MADFDSAVKRYAGFGFTGEDPPLLPIPDATIDVTDRMHFLDTYYIVPAVGGGSIVPILIYQYRMRGA